MKRAVKRLTERFQSKAIGNRIQSSNPPELAAAMAIHRAVSNRIGF
jgi:hypothetical protein